MSLLSADNRRDTLIAWGFVAGQFALIVLVLALPSGSAWTVPGWLRAAALALGLVGLAALVVGIANLGRSLTALPTPVEHGELRRDGLYRLVRHPIYAGIIGLAASSALRSGSWAVVAATAALTGWFSAKARWEEMHLRRRYPDYADYAARTPRFVPFWPFGADRR